MTRAFFSALSLRVSAGITLALTLLAPAVWADGLFSPALYVNGSAVTGFELQQRSAFLEMIRTPGDLEQQARDALIDDKLRLQTAKKLELTLSDEDLKKGMVEFAGRANLTLEQFTDELSKAGIEEQSFRDFVYAGLLWRDVVRAKFGPRVTVSAQDIDYAMDLSLQRAEVKLLLSELVVPYAPEKKPDAQAFINDLRTKIGSAEDFAAAATQYSASPTAPKGGELEWLPLSNLPASLGPLLLSQPTGTVSDVISVPGAFVLFFKRGVSDAPMQISREQQVDYAQVLVAANDAELLGALQGKADDCDDLYTVTKGLPADRMLRDNKPLSQVPADIALELAKLDPGDSSTALVRGGWRVFLMLCTREPIKTDKTLTRDQVAIQLRNQKLALYAENYLRELRADAIIRTP